MLIKIYKEKGKRLLSLLLALTMLLPYFTGAISAADDPDQETVSIQTESDSVVQLAAESAADITGYQVDIAVFNYMYRSDTDPAGNPLYSANGVFAFTGNFGHSITIGGIGNADDIRLNPMSNDISVTFAGLTVAGDVTIYPVYPENPSAYKTVLTVTETSSVTNLVLQENAVAELWVNADFEIQKLTLSTGSSLTLYIDEKCTLSLNEMNGEGSISVSGGTISGSSWSAGTLAVNGTTVNVTDMHAAGTLVLSGAIVNAGGSVTANEIDATNTVIRNAMLVGADSDAAGTVNIRFVDCSFTSVSRVGAADDCAAQVRFAADCSVNTYEADSYVRDYTVTYVVETDAIGDNWIRSYRVESKTLAGAGTVITEDTTLPSYSTPGYSYRGWKTEPNGENYITNLTGQQGDLNLYPDTAAAMITVTMDLMCNLGNENYDDAERMESLYSKLTAGNTSAHEVVQELDTILELDKPNRFGYSFVGWRLSGTDTVITDSTFAIVYNQLTDKENYTLKLEAVWNRNSFPLYWTFDSIPLEYIEISVDGGKTWYNPVSFINAHSSLWAWEEDSRTMRTLNAGEILYGETLDEYFERLDSGWRAPILRDKRSLSENADEVKDAQAFQMWYWNDQKLPVYASNTFDTDADVGILYNKKDTGITWAEYQDTKLKLSNMVILSSVFGTADYNLYISASEWTYQVNDEIRTPVDGVLVVPNGAKVTLSCPLNSGMSICNWSIQSLSEITVQERYLNGDTVYYDFVMPACDVTASYQEAIGVAYVNIANGSITFADDEIPTDTGLKRDGFWYDDHLSGGTSENYQLPLVNMTPLCFDEQKGYFYIWDMAQPLYVTSDGVGTTNQLILVGATTVNFNQCYLQARQAYTDKFIDMTFGGYVAKGKLADCTDWKDSGNIIISRDKLEKYTINLNFEASNTIAAIMPDQWYFGSNYEGTINLTAASGHQNLILGSVWDNATISCKNLKILSYSDAASDCDKDRSDYLFCTYGGTTVINGTMTFRNCDIDAPTKQIRAYYGYSNIYSCTVDLGSWYSYYQYDIDDSNMHIFGDFIHDVGYSFYNTTLLVDGSIYGTSHREENYGGKMYGGSSVIVLGNIAEFINLTIEGSSLLVANVVALEEFNMKDGTLVTNMLTAPVSGSRAFGSDGLIPKTTVSLGSPYANQEGYPFVTRLHEKYIENNVYSGGTMYLTGYYPYVAENGGIFDGTWTAMDDKNPVGQFIQANQLIVEDNWNSNASITDFSAMTDYTGGGECIVFGNSQYNNSVSMVDHTFSGSSIYAAGNITLFNDTVVSAGEIECKGTFSSKLDLTITGGTINASEIGNSYNFTEQADNGNLRWQKTIISGGTLTAGRIGALTKSQGDGTVESRSTLVITDGAALTDQPQLVCDTCVNYFYSEEIFTVGENADNVRYSGNDYSKLKAEGTTTFAAPVLVDETGYGNWLLDSLSGSKVDSVSEEGRFCYESTEIKDALAAYGVRDNINLYAVKTSYTMYIRDGLNYLDSVTVADQSAQVTEEVSVAAESIVQIMLKDTSMSDKVVIWYEDDAGKIYNVMPTVNTVDGRAVVQFKMPFANVEMFVADAVTLYLDKNEICITETGFELEYSDASDNRKFTYGGNLIIADSRITSTKANSGKTKVVDQDGEETYTTTNRIHISADTGDRKITFTKVIQVHERQTYSIYLEDNLEVSLYVDGVVRLGVIHLPENSALTMEGVKRNTMAEKPGTENYDDMIVMSAKGDEAFIRVSSGKLGTFTGRYLQFGVESTSRRLVESSSWTDKPFTLEHCKYINNYYYYKSTVFSYINTVVLRDCYFVCAQYSDTSNPFAYIKNFQVDSTEIYFTLGGGRASYNPFSNITLTEILGDSHFEVTEKQNTGEIYISYAMETNRLVVGGNATLKYNQRLALPDLTVKDNGSVVVGGNGYLFCKKLYVQDNASVTAGYILSSGYFEHSGSYSSDNNKTPSGVQSALNKDNNLIVDGSSFDGIVITGGTVTASQFIGGDKNGKLTISGGVLNAPKIGTYGALFGYPSYLPKSGSDEPWCYTSEKIPAGGTVTISGDAVVNVSEYLGGMNASVQIQGGKVNLNGNAVLGMTDDQMAVLKAYYVTVGTDIAAQKDANITVEISGGEVVGEEGSINTPYGTATISGVDTKVNVQNIAALYGDVTISQSRGTYSHHMNENDPVGVYVGQLLTAQEILIENDARVYAKNAMVNAPEVDDKAALSVLDASVLYTEVYGSSGQGSVTITGTEKINIVNKSRQYSITYIMHDDETDKATNHEDNPDTFVFSPEVTDNIQLEDPSRDGFTFVRWYAYDDEGNIQTVSSLSRSTSHDVILHAEWKPEEVKFEICVDTSAKYVGTVAELAEMAEKGIITIDGAIITFVKTVSVPYRDDIFGTGEYGIVLDDFTFPSYKILKLQVQEDGLTYELEAATATVTKELLNAYKEKSAAIRLFAVNVTKKNEMLVMDLNVGENGRPVGAKFQESQAESDGNTIYGRAAVGDTIASVDGMVIDGELNQPTAPGYSFVGWNTMPDGSGVYIGTDYVVGGGNATHFYAQWQRNGYTITFDADGGFVTKDNVPVFDGDDTLDAYVIYDAPIKGGISYEYGEQGTQALPFAWRPGYHFVGWSVDGGKTILDTEELNETTFGTMDLADPSEEKASVLTLTAVYTPVTVTYHTNGGIFTEEWLEKSGTEELLDEQNDPIWKSESNGQTVGYALPLAGYVKNVTEKEDVYELRSAVKGGDEATYAVLSTTASYYQNYGYHADDYRYVIGRKGYTFEGWKTEADGTGESVGTLPAYEDIELYAQWSPNTYTLVLNQGTSQYSAVHTGNGPANGKTVTVHVGEEIDGTLDTAESNEIRDNWSNRTGWFVQANSSLSEAKDDERYILGFTFDDLEPGAPSNSPNDTTSESAVAYLQYAADVTKLINHGALLTKTEMLGDVKTEGSEFYLPADDDYNSELIQSAKVVPDYPNGSTIQMYAIYRERSLVFIQRYVDGNDQVQETVMYSAPYTVYSDYPNDYLKTEAYQNVVKEGYSLVKWSVNDIQNGADYCAFVDKYQTVYLQWQKEANDNGSYDINIYTVYAAKVEREVIMEASKAPESEYTVSQTYSIPGSMVVDYMLYELEIAEDSIELVSMEEWREGRYDAEKTRQVAIEMELINADGSIRETLSLTKDGGNSTNLIGKGWKIQFKLYHSGVIPETEELPFKITMTFRNETAQEIVLNATVKLVPTEWTVNYTANLPDDPYLKVIKDNDFSGTGNSRTFTVNNWIYGTDLKAETEIPEVEGYEGIGVWTFAGDNTTYGYGSSGTMKLSASDPIALTTSYQKCVYQLVNNTNGKCNVTDVGDVSYHTVVTIEPVETDPAFIWLDYGEQKYRLDLLKAGEYPFYTEIVEGKYKILMPAGDVTVSYVDTLELYLGNGTIDITPSGYTQNENTVEWPGDYTIYQWPGNTADSATSNVLNLSGDLSVRNDGSGAARTIYLGNLSIVTEDSIALAEDTIANLIAMGTITAKNLQVPASASLTLAGMNQTDRAKVELSPDTSCAAIGGSGETGNITLLDMDLTLKMPAGSNASAIGSGNGETEKAGAIQITRCEITVVEGETLETNYTGTWIGGKLTESIGLSDTILNNPESIRSIDMVNADCVRINGCTIGAEDDRIENHRIRGGTIMIDSSELYLSGTSTLLCAENELYVDQNWQATGDGSVISIIGTHPDRFYLGTMKICADESDVVLWNYRFMDQSNGTIVITPEGGEQGDTQFVHTGPYWLLNVVEPDSVSDLTVQGLQENMIVKLDSGCRFNTLAIEGDAVLDIEGDSDQTNQKLIAVSSVTIEEGKVLTVQADDNTGLNPEDFGVKGSYTQIGGLLNSEKDLVAGGDMTLNGVAVTASGAVGSNGAAGVTTVTITASKITAATIGAAGAHNETFTFVVVDDDSQLNGKLVRDHYRLYYDLSDPNFNADALDTVLRSETVYENSDQGKITYLPAIPEPPAYTGEGTSYFGNWYFLDEDEKVAVSSEPVKGFNRSEELNADTIGYAVDTDTDDGTKTLQLYNWMNLTGTGMIAYGRELNELSSGASTTKIEINGAWTARFAVEGVMLDDAEYCFTFESAIPAGTKLTLRFGSANPEYYYYIPVVDVQTVKESDFIRMGETTVAEISEDSDEFSEYILQLTADFSGLSAVENKVFLSLVSKNGSYPIADVSYTVKAAATASCTADARSVTYTVTENGDTRLVGKQVYLAARLKKDGDDVSVPYGAQFLVDGVTGNWIGGNMVYFPLGAYGELSQTAEWEVTGLEEGEYSVKWYLTVSDVTTQNVFGTVLSKSEETVFTVTAQGQPYLDVILATVDGNVPTGYVLSAENAHTIVFTYKTNGSEVQVLLEKQGNLQSFAAAGDSATGIATGTAVSIPAEAGVYRIRFSLDKFLDSSSDWDDVYFTFIVK